MNATQPPDTAQAPDQATWRDPAAWREDPSSAAQAAAAEAKTTFQATAVQVNAKAQSLLSDFEERTADRPEKRVGAVFAAGIVSALILKRLAR